jgi:hypothetical protein
VITDFRLSEDKIGMEAYLAHQEGTKIILNNPKSGKDSESIDLDLYDQAPGTKDKAFFNYNGNFWLTPSQDLYDALPATVNYYNPGSRNNYEYLFYVQNRIQFTAKEADQLPDYTYINPYSFFRNGWKWRIIATSFNAKLNQYTFTLHHSTAID